MENHTITKLVVLGIAITVANIATVQAAKLQKKPQISRQTTSAKPAQQNSQLQLLPYTLECKILGTPNDFPNDVAIINKGPGTVPAGTGVHFGTNAAYYGSTRLPMLTPGKLKYVINVVPGGLPRGTPCGVSLFTN